MNPVPVHYASASGYGAGTLRPALEKALGPVLAARGGVSGASLMLKPNLLFYRRSGDIAAVDPRVVVETVRLLRDAGAEKLTIIENPGTQSAPAVIRAMGIADELKKLGVETFNCERYKETEMASGSVFRRLALATEFRDFDAVVNIARAKTHAMMTLTLAVKNLFGLVRGADRLGWHLTVGCDYARFADLLLDLYLEVRPEINLLDGIVCMEGNGPGSGTPAERNFVAASADALVLDASAAVVLGVPELLLLENARKRGILPEYANGGDAVAVNPLKLPEPPGILCEWGVALPPFFKKKLRNLVATHPVVDPALCIGCGRCAEMCPPRSLVMDSGGKPRFCLDECIRCYCCQEHCPKGAIRPEKQWLMELMEKFERRFRR